MAVLAAAVLAVGAYRAGLGVGAAVAAPARVVTEVPTSEKVVAFTFDDGPTARWTPQILGILRADKVPATFFVIGQEVVRHPELVTQEVQAGMEIGNHGFRHRRLRGLDRAAIVDEVRQGAQAIETAGAPAPTLYRLPAGVWDRTALSTLGSLGYTVVGWSVDPQDWRHRFTAQQMTDLVLKTVRPGAIVIFHDGTNSSAATVDAVRALIPALKGQGYRFVTVGQLLRINKSRI
jgi:peptidoglycan/xylan/chitin deacetylase (PgdA/CDA1 family)